MKKTYQKPETENWSVAENLEILARPKPGSNGGTGSILVKDRDDETEGGDSPIWGEDGKLW